MIKNLQEIRHALAVKLGLARSNEQRAADQDGHEEREAFEALQAIEIDWQKAREGLRENLHRAQAVEVQERLRQTKEEADAERKIGGMFGKHARRDEPEIEPDEQVAASPSREENQSHQTRKGLFAERARPAEHQDRDEPVQEPEDQAKLDEEQARRKEAAIARVRARLARERQQDRDYGISR